MRKIGASPLGSQASTAVSGNLREKHRRNRVTQVLDAAAELFAHRGYEATRIEQIAEQASVAPATIYNYFDTKPNLLLALALRHVRQAIPERRSFLAKLPADPVKGFTAFERLLAEQALRHLSRDCWRIILSAQFLEPAGRAASTGARLATLISLQYVQIIRAYQARGRIRPDVDPASLADLIVGITTMDFGRFVARADGTIEEMLSIGVKRIKLIMTGLLLPQTTARSARS
jgi:AcrR family transcriptional regulator